MSLDNHFDICLRVIKFPKLIKVKNNFYMILVNLILLIVVEIFVNINCDNYLLFL